MKYVIELSPSDVKRLRSRFKYLLNVEKGEVATSTFKADQKLFEKLSGFTKVVESEEVKEPVKELIPEVIPEEDINEADAGPEKDNTEADEIDNSTTETTEA